MISSAARNRNIYIRICNIIIPQGDGFTHTNHGRSSLRTELNNNNRENWPKIFIFFSYVKRWARPAHSTDLKESNPRAKMFLLSTCGKKREPKTTHRMCICRHTILSRSASECQNQVTEETRARRNKTKKQLPVGEKIN